MKLPTLLCGIWFTSPHSYDKKGRPLKTAPNDEDAAMTPAAIQIMSSRLAALQRLLRPTAVASVLLCSSLLPARAIDLLSGFGNDGVYGALALQPNDDESSSLLDLPFTINFFGNSYDSFYVNNNGNVTFGNPVGDFTPQAFPVAREI